ILAGALCAAGLLGALFVGPRAYDFVTGAAQDAERPNEEQPSPTQPRSEPDAAEPPPRTRVSSTTEPAVNPDKPNVGAEAMGTPASDTAVDDAERPPVDQTPPGDEPDQTDTTQDQPELPDTAKLGPVPPSPDPSQLAETSGYLYVSSTIDAAVFVHGVAVGRTNAWLESHCGFRFILLGNAPGQWLSAGLPTKVGCRKSTQIELL